MDQNQPIPFPAPLSTTGTDADDAELLQAQAELCCHAWRHMESMALKCAIDLGIPSAIHRNGGSASLPDLLATLPIAENKRPFLHRLMRFLTVSGIFTSADDGVYQLTRVSRLLVDSIPLNLLPFAETVSVQSGNFHTVFTRNFRSFLCLGEWFRDGGDTTPFAMAHGIDVWGAMSLDRALAAGFSASMAADSKFLAEIAIRRHVEAFMNVSSLVDVGGGDGSMARAIVKAFPHIKCLVLDLPHVVRGIPADGFVEYVAGDMMDFVPPANVVLLKLVLHDWSDEDCVRILSRCREAISNREGGKVIIIDTVIGSQSQQIYEAQLFLDLCMMTVTTGKEREEKEWHMIFLKAGFTQYKILPILGIKSLIEVYP
uniref:Flavonoid 7-O-methyltransferase n=1 Tax=Oryza sativa subsp. japonica TaxID=39947 RepID=Q6Z028_ORYSJ|nr:putative flavonoid 7-O-methyltransferase [Oryza sativa Japonica Group]BAD05699.1 putative flavonoid 7-O-methyltransferase [Oryza sativa Japonica Group]